MLTEIMQALAGRQMFHLEQLAEATGYTRREIEGALIHLEQMGYIKRQAVGCSSGACRGGSHDAWHCQGCALAARSDTGWVLTDRGYKVADGKN